MCPDDATWTAHPALEKDGLVHGVCSLTSLELRSDRDRARSVMASRLARHGVVFSVRQVHGTDIAVAPCDRPEADGVIVAHPGEIAMVETADCMPLLMVDTSAHLAAAVHAGWRGTAQGIAQRAVAELGALGADPSRVQVLLGPAIGACCYEVGADLRDAFLPVDQVHFRGRHPHLDLRAANVAQLLREGLRPNNIHHLEICTACSPSRYPSYRRDGPGCGRLFSLVGWIACER